VNLVDGVGGHISPGLDDRFLHRVALQRINASPTAPGVS
jgi:hypothetical protein